MLMSELVTHASAEKCGDLLKVRKPTQGALHKGATLIIMVLFFLKHSTNLLWLGTYLHTSACARFSCLGWRPFLKLLVK